MKCLKLEKLHLLIQKTTPTAKIIISLSALRVNKAESDISNKRFISFLNSTNWYCIHHQNNDELQLNEYGLYINRTGCINLANILISRIRKF